MTSPIEDLLARHVEAGVMPGAVALLGDADDPRPVAVGTSSLGGPALGTDAIFRIQSMTKAVTAVAALRLVAAGRLSLDDDVERWLPELAARRVLVAPTASLDDTVPAAGPITLRHLLTNTSGYGSILEDSPLRDAMVANGTEAGPEPITLGADEWLARLSDLPLAFDPGAGWRYHHSFGILGVLLSRLVGRTVDAHLREDLFAPLGMVDTGFWVPEQHAARLPAAYRHEAGALVETEPAGGGFYRGEPPFAVDHAELVSTADDYARFLRALVRNDRGGAPLLPEALAAAMTTDQVPAAAKTPESFFPGFWDGMGWGFGVGVHTSGRHAGRYGWSGGQGTDFFVDPDGTIGVLLTQVEMGERIFPLLGDFQALAA